jgi:hypothetical protein
MSPRLMGEARGSVLLLEYPRGGGQREALNLNLHLTPASGYCSSSLSRGPSNLAVHFFFPFIF